MRLRPLNDPRILVGHNHADDAGILKISDTQALVTTVDLLAPVVDDPFEFGCIAATNCLSDIFAMAGKSPLRKPRWDGRDPPVQF